MITSIYNNNNNNNMNIDSITSSFNNNIFLLWQTDSFSRHRGSLRCSKVFVLYKSIIIRCPPADKQQAYDHNNFYVIDSINFSQLRETGFSLKCVVLNVVVQLYDNALSVPVLEQVLYVS